MLRKLMRLLVLKFLPRGRKGYLSTEWEVNCTWGESADVTLVFDRSVHLMFSLSSQEAKRLAGALLQAASVADELDIRYRASIIEESKRASQKGGNREEKKK